MPQLEGGAEDGRFFGKTINGSVDVEKLERSLFGKSQSGGHVMNASQVIFSRNFCLCHEIIVKKSCMEK